MTNKNILLKVIQQFLQFVISIIIAKQVGASGNGYFSVFITEVSFVILLIGFSSESTVTYFLANKKITLNQVLTLTVGLLIFQFFLFGIIIFFSSRILHYSIFSVGPYKQGVVWAFLFVFSSILQNISGAVLFVNRMFQKFFVSGIILQLFFLSLMIYSMLNPANCFFKIDYFIPVYSLLITAQSVLILLVTFWTFRKTVKFESVADIKFKEVGRYVLLVCTANIIQFLCYRMDIWFVDYYHSKNDVGLYAFASKISQMWWVLPQIFAGFFFPLAALKHSSMDNYKKTIVKILAFTLVTSFIAILLYPVFIKYFVGESYMGSFYPFVYLLPGVILFSVNILLAAKFAGDGNVAVNLVASTICFVIVLALDILLIPHFGIKGAAIASSIAYTCSSIFAILWFFKNEKKLLQKN